MYQSPEIYQNPNMYQSQGITGGSKYEALHMSHQQTSYSSQRSSLAPGARDGLGRRRWRRTVVSQILGLLWLAPITTLLILNWKGHIIGASAWCPRGGCSADPFGNDAIQRAQKLDKDDHNTNGALQFVAKALEVWFVFVASSLVYNVAMMFAAKGGLPIGYLMAHLEFADLRNLIDPLLWTTPAPAKTLPSKGPFSTIKLYLFAIFAAFMCVLANLMGPATAVLVLPTLQWKDTPYTLDSQFVSLDSGSPPAGDSVLTGCNATTLETGNYSCTSNVYGPMLDDWLASGIANLRQGETNNYFAVGGGVSQERSVAFTLNTSSTSKYDFFWVPNRQVMRDLSWDFENFVNMTRGKPFDPAYATYNNSLQTVLKRQGPVIGLSANILSLGHAGNVTIVAEDRQIWCYPRWSAWASSSSDYYNKCYRVGSGWNKVNTVSQFSISAGNASANDVNVFAFFSDKATYFNVNTTFGTPAACLANGTAPTDGSCNWDSIFAADLPLDLKNASVNNLVLEFSLPNSKYPGKTWVVEFNAYLDFPVYSLDTSSSSNPLFLVQVDNLAQDQTELKYNEPLVVDPNWILAAWSVDRDGVVPSDRAAATGLVQTMAKLLSDQLSGSDDQYLTQLVYLLYLTGISIGQSMSMVSYSSNLAPSNPSADAVQDPINPIFTHYATIHVWAYGLSGRTSYLGIAVVLVGVACVLVRTVFSLLSGLHERSTVEIIVAALEHRPQGEFDGLDHEKHMAKIRYEIIENQQEKLKFVPEARYHGVASVVP